MQLEGKTPVIITQEVLALLTTRKEAAERISAKLTDEKGAEKIRKKSSETDAFINELMDELQQYGDAIMGETDRDNDYQNTWKKTLKVLDTGDSGELLQRFTEMELIFASTYRTVCESIAELPDTLKEKLVAQMQKIEAGIHNNQS